MREGRVGRCKHLTPLWRLLQSNVCKSQQCSGCRLQVALRAPTHTVCGQAAAGMKRSPEAGWNWLGGQLMQDVCAPLDW